MPAAQTAAFKKAVGDSRKLTAKPTDDELLQVYTPTTNCMSHIMSTQRTNYENRSSMASTSKEPKTLPLSRPPLPACSS